MSQSTLLGPPPALRPGAITPVPRRRRRPSGEPPPLPYDLGRSGRRWIWLGGAVILTWLLVALVNFGGLVDKADHFLLERIVSLRSDLATSIAHRLEWLGSHGRLLLMHWVVIVVALAFRRFRHLFVFLGCVVFTTWATSTLSGLFARPRPDTVEILGPVERVRPPVPAPRRDGRGAHRPDLHRRAPRPHPQLGQGGGRCPAGAARGRPPVPGRRVPHRRPLRAHLRRGGDPGRLPHAGAAGQLPGDVPAGEVGPPRRRRGPGRGHRQGPAGAARPRRGGRQALRPRRARPARPR